MDINFSEKHTISIFRVDPEKEKRYSSKTVVSTSKTTQSCNPKGYNLNNRHPENLKIYVSYNYFMFHLTSLNKKSGIRAAPQHSKKHGGAVLDLP
jgi:hypothetical protein